LEEYHDAIFYPTTFKTILVKHVGYAILYDLGLSESVGQIFFDVIKFSFPTRPPPSQWKTVTNFMKANIRSYPICSIDVDYPLEWLL